MQLMRQAKTIKEIRTTRKEIMSHIPIEYRIEELERLEDTIKHKRETLRREMGHSLTALIKLKGLTQRSAAVIAGLSHGTIAAMCNNRAHNKPSLRTTLKAFRDISNFIG